MRFPSGHVDGQLLRDHRIDLIAELRSALDRLDVLSGLEGIDFLPKVPPRGAESSQTGSCRSPPGLQSSNQSETWQGEIHL